MMAIATAREVESSARQETDLLMREARRRAITERRTDDEESRTIYLRLRRRRRIDGIKVSDPRTQEMVDALVRVVDDSVTRQQCGHRVAARLPRRPGRLRRGSPGPAHLRAGLTDTRRTGGNVRRLSA